VTSGCHSTSSLVMRFVVVALLLVVGVATLVAARGCRSVAPPGGPPETPRERIYIADWGNHRLVRMDDMRGTNWTTLGPAGDGAFRFPVGGSVDPSGRVYVTEQQHRLIRIDDFRGTGWTAFTPHGPGPTRSNKYAGSWVFFDDRGRIYTTYDGRHRVV